MGRRKQRTRQLRSSLGLFDKQFCSDMQVPNHLKLSGSSPALLQNIRVSGNKRMKLSYFENEFRDAMQQSKCLDDYVKNVAQVTGKLQQCGIFEAVDTELDVHNFENGRFNVDVKLRIIEKGIPYLKMESFVKSGTQAVSDVGGEIQGALRSPFGFGEMIKLGVGTSSVGTREASFQITAPHISKRRAILDFTARSTEDNSSFYTSYKQHIQSLCLQLTSLSQRHSVALELAGRDELPIPHPHSNHSNQYLASSTIMSQIAPSTKLSLKYNYIRDSRDSACSPSTGNYLAVTQELALPPGSAQYAKLECAAQHHRVVGPSIFGQIGAVFSLCGGVGVMRSLASLGLHSSHSDRDKIPLCDRYHVGGPLNLRGFSHHGTGPRALGNKVASEQTPDLGPQTSAATAANGGVKMSLMKPSSTSSFSSFSGLPQGQQHSAAAVITTRPAEHGDSLGGTSRVNLLAALSVPVPVPALAAAGVRALFFVNAGSVGGGVFGETEQSIRGNFKQLKARRRGLTFNNTSNGGADTDEVVNRPRPVFGHVRLSAGVGLCASLSNMARLEVTYSVPVIRASHDIVKPFQFGIGLSIN